MKAMLLLALLFFPISSILAEESPASRSDRVAELSEALLAKNPEWKQADSAWKEKLAAFLQSHGIDREMDGETKADLVAGAAMILSGGSEKIVELWGNWNIRQSKKEDEEKQGEETNALDWITSTIGTSSDDPEKILSGVVPTNWIYQGLLEEFRALGEMADSGEENPLPMPGGDEIVNPGEKYSGATELGKRLKEGGYLEKSVTVTGEIYTQELSDALKRFQDDQGLKDDGIIGPNTLEGLNRTVADRLQSLKLNLDRARLLPRDLGERHIIVNLPSGNLFTFDKGDLKEKMKIVFGEAGEERSTRIFADRMSSVVFRPYWNIPVSIASKEIVPKARKNWGYLQAKDYEIVPEYTHSGNAVSVSSGALSQVQNGNLLMRQKPGPKNSLGLVKFLFPNDHNIYLHDTPDDSLFSRSTRTFSHGCVRVERPAELAEWVLEPQGWTGEEVSTALSEGGDNEIDLETEIEVYIVYLTALPLLEKESAVSDTAVRYYRDIYERDGAASKALSQNASAQ